MLFYQHFHQRLELLIKSMSVFVLLEVKVGGSEAGGGTWIHPQAAIHLAMWISPKFAVQVIDWTARFISGDLTIMVEIAAQHAAVNPNNTTLVTVTTGGAEIDQDSVSLLHQDNVMAHKDDNNTITTP